MYVSEQTSCLSGLCPQRTALVKFHNRELRMLGDGDGDWELREIHASRMTSGRDDGNVDGPRVHFKEVL